MRIALVSIVFPHPRRGIFPGIERHIYDYSRALRKTGIDVRVLTSFWNGGSEREDFKGLEIHRIPDTGTRYGRLGRLFSRNLQSFGRNLSRREDLFEHVDLVQTFTAVPQAGFLDGTHLPIVSNFYHRDKPSRYREYFTLPSLFAMEVKLYRSVPLILTFSDSSRRVLIDEYGVDGKKIAITPLGVDTDKFAPAGKGNRVSPPNPFRMLFVGPLIERKGVHHLMDALARVNERRADWSLTLAGDGRERASLQARATELGFPEKVDFLGYIDGWGDELPRIYREADLFVFPSLKEGFGMVIIEAMACGTPVLTSRVSAIPEVVGNAGVLVEPSNPQQLADGILRFMEDDELRKGLSAAGLQRVRDRYSWEVVVKRTLEAFQSVVPETNAGGIIR